MPREPFVRRSAAAAVTSARADGAPPTPSRRPRVPGLRARLLGLLEGEHVGFDEATMWSTATQGGDVHA